MAVVATMGITACGLFGENNSFGVRTGDCFDQDAPASVSASEVEVVDCSEPHEFEVFHVEELPKGDFPGEAAVSAAAVEACEGENFESFVGVEYLSSEIYSWSLVPQASDWEESGYREIVCYLSIPGEALSGTLEGADR
ncbi:septum formation family protein [Nocardiopsis exhalans]|uniref:Septum formation family protein n=1 Tax=Nocardiopsis exhalans TaxID=163604 RepID=A0ABY5D265_9ACTN|nr:septum formation family protein [Nocardiopsis exhalans]USY18112.1 septum formation family protein [Nocardiopsis exhalans]